MLVYGIHDGHVPIILGYLTPPVIAARNLMLIARHEKRNARNRPSGRLRRRPLDFRGDPAASSR